MHALRRIATALVFLIASATAQQLTPSLLDGVPFRLIGPASPAGRVWHITGVPQQPKTFYVCTADGGVWKTTNFGTTLEPVFDDQPAASCGPIPVSASDPNVVWVGTGEPASTRANSLGRGVFKSLDAGKTWQAAGLQDTEEIGAIVIDPRSPQTVYVAALGHLWGRNAERGVFKTADGGKTWSKVLFVNDETGFIDLKQDPHHPDVLYAAAWQRLRWGNGDMTESGPGSGIYKSTDAGAHWTRLSDGLPTDPMGKITLAVAPKNSQIVYAAILTGQPTTDGKRTSDQGGVFRSEDGGAHWQRVNAAQTSYYYDLIVADPKDDNRVWMPVLELMRSDDGGRTWVKHNMKHVHDDLHALWIYPNDPANIALGGDGGVNTTLDGGRTWMQNVIPIAQFYEIDVDNQEPYFVYAGMQDTGHWTAPSQTYDNEGITNHDWIKLRFNGDGMAIHPDPRDPNVIYMVQEFGNTSRLDLRTWTRAEIQPEQKDNPEWSSLHKFRWDWTPPMILDASNPDVLYLGANYVFRCDVAKLAPATHNNVCQTVSPDLTAQQEKENLSGPKDGYHSYGALFSLAQSPVDANVLWAGADDGPIHVSKDGGKTWTRVDENICAAVPRAPSPANAVANDAWRSLASKCAITRGVVSRIEPSKTAVGTAYVAYDLHTLDDRQPYLFKTQDFGQTWTDMANDLPKFGPSYIIREDPNNPRVLLVGTEFGLYVSIDGGSHWTRWKSNLPMAAVRSMVIQAREREVVVGTFGRAIWIGDLAPLEQMAEALAQPAFLMQPKPAVAFNVRYTYGATIEELNGDMFFRGENPPYGTTLYYYLREAIPGGVRITVSGEKNRVVRRLDGPGTPGLHAILWDLETDKAKQAAAAPPTPEERELTLSERQARRRVKPGNYLITLYAGSAILTRTVEVRPERADGVQRAMTRK